MFMNILKFKDVIKTSKKKIAEFATNKNVLVVAVFFYLVLILIELIKKDYGQLLDNNNNFINIIKSAAPVVAAAASSAASGTAAGTAAASGASGAAGGAASGAAGGAASETAATAANTARNAENVKNASNVKGKPSNVKSNEMEQPKHVNQSTKKTTTKTDSATSDLKSKSSRLEENTQKKPSRLEQEVKNRGNSRLSGDNEKDAENETDMEEASSELIGKKSGSLASKILIVVVIAFFFLFMGMTMISFSLISPIQGVLLNVLGIAEVVGNKVNGLAERLKNAITLNGYNTDEQVLYNKITEQYEYYLKKEGYAVEIDIPILAATLFLDSNDNGYGTSNNGADRDGDGLPDVSENIQKKIDSVGTLASYMFQRFESKFLCTSEVVDGVTIYKNKFIASYPSEEERSNTVCSAGTVGTEIYESKYEINTDFYYDRLRETDILNTLYPDKVETSADKEALISRIELSVDLWKSLYEELGEDECPSSGTIPGSVLSEMQSPVLEPYGITSYYGYRTGIFAGFHAGIDVVPTVTKNIFAIADGQVTRANKETLGGNVVEITHIINGVTYISQYAHLADGSVTVSRGEYVQKGQSIAVMGATGNVSGAHLHFQLFKDNRSMANTLNPVNLFSSASNYIYNCSKTTTKDECSFEGAIAKLAQKNGYSFNLLRSIVTKQIKSDSSEVLYIDFDPTDLQRKLNSLSIEKSQTIKNKINFDNFTVLSNGIWVSFSTSSDQVGKNEVLKLIGSADETAYLDVYMGNVQIKGSNYGNLGFSSAKSMYSSFLNSKYTQVESMIKYFNSKSESIINILKNIDSSTQLSSDINTIINTYKSYKSDETYTEVYNNYTKFNNNSTSTIDNYINECGFTSAEIDWACHFSDKAYCSPTEEVSNFVSLVKDNSKLTVKQRAVLEPALSLWLKVNYCGTKQPDYNYCANGGYDIIGINSKWKSDSFGLDSSDYVTWVMNQLNNSITTINVLNDACKVDTSYSKVNIFGDGNINNVISQIKQGDVVCDKDFPDRSAMIYLGYEDKNSDGYPNSEDSLYFIYSSGGSNGVIVSSKKISELNNINSYFTYE